MRGRNNIRNGLLCSLLNARKDDVQVATQSRSPREPGKRTLGINCLSFHVQDEVSHQGNKEKGHFFLYTWQNYS